jgi:putative membrane protein
MKLLTTLLVMLSVMLSFFCAHALAEAVSPMKFPKQNRLSPLAHSHLTRTDSAPPFRAQFLTLEEFNSGIGANMIPVIPSLQSPPIPPGIMPTAAIPVQAPVKTQHHTVSSADAQFIKTAAHQGWLEMQYTKVALDHTLGAELNIYANSLMRDQSLAISELERLADARGILLTENPDPNHTANLERLSKLLGEDEFNAEFLSILYRLHERTVAIYENGAVYSRDDEVRVFAQNQLAMMRRHLQHVRSLRDNAAKGGLTVR